MLNLSAYVHTWTAGSYLITDSYGNMTHFDFPPFFDPKTLPLKVLDPDVNTWNFWEFFFFFNSTNQLNSV